ncbi:MAG: hypothetical protein ACRCWG_09390 [Sarcina sp.]
MIKFRAKLVFENKKLILINILFFVFIVINISSLWIWGFDSTSTDYFWKIFKLNGYYLLIALMSGYMVGATEINSKCLEIFDSMYDVKRKVMNQKIIIGLCLSIGAWLVHILMLVIGVLVSGEGLWSVRGLFASTINMILIPIIICTIIGIFIGDSIKKEKAYILLTMIWLLVTPLNVMIYSMIEIFDKDTILRWNLTLGSTYQDAFDGVLGAYTDSHEFAKLAIFLFVLGCIYTYKYLSGKKYIYLLSLVGIVFCFYDINDNRYNIIDDTDRYRTSDFYALDAQLNLEEKDAFDNYNIEKYEVDITPDSKAKFKVSLDIKLNEDTEHLSFMLFNDFEITSLTDGENNDLTFTRDEDFVDVNLGKSFEKNEKVLLDIEYGGVSGKDFFIREEGSQLNSRFPYIPSNKIHDVMDINGFASYFDLSVPSYYEVRVHDEREYYSNLENSEKNVFKGKADGLILLSGDNIIKEECASVNYYYGNLQKYKSKEDVETIKKAESMKNVINSALMTLDNTFSENGFEEIKNFFVIYSKDLNNIDIVGDSVIIYTNYIDPMTEKDYMRMILEEELKGVETEERTIISRYIFVDVAMQYFQNNELAEVTQITFHENEEQMEIHSKLVNTINALSDDKKEELYKEFYQLCLTDIDYKKLDELAEKYKGFEGDS